MIYHPRLTHTARPATDGRLSGGGWRKRRFFVVFFGRVEVSSQMYAHIRRNPRFAELVARRTRLAVMLSAVVLVIFYGFVMMVAFAPDVVATRLFEGSNLTVGIALGLFQFVLFWVLTLVYVRRANGEFDDLNKEIVQAAWKETK